jgi:hypothetical protein
MDIFSHSYELNLVRAWIAPASGRLGTQGRHKSEDDDASYEVLHGWS